MNNAEYAAQRNLNEGATIPLINWQIELRECGSEWTMCHYVGGEDYEIYGDFFDTKAEAEALKVYLNTTLPPQGHTHYYTFD
tara:strand:- start:1065 stop:1310 length:246 start_codon:yes stop_codon:yes gene_type:complete